MGTGDTRITLTLMGSFEMQVDGRCCPPLPRKAEALIALLALQNEHPLAREAVVELLWSGPGAGFSGGTLRQTLAAIREQTGIGLVRLAGGMMTLRRTGVAVDALQFEALAGSADRSDLARCAALYRGELLANVAKVTPRFDEWLAVERIRLAEIAAEVMRTLSLSLADAGDYDGAVAAAQQVVSLDELREDSHHLLISVLGRCGRRTEALRHYGMCERLLLTPHAREPEPAPVFAATVAAPASRNRGRWLRSALAVGCLLVAMVGSVAVEPGTRMRVRSPLASVADTVGLPGLFDGAARPARKPARLLELPAW